MSAPSRSHRTKHGSASRAGDEHKIHRSTTICSALAASAAPSVLPVARFVPFSYGSPSSRHFAATPGCGDSHTAHTAWHSQRWQQSAPPRHQARWLGNAGSPAVAQAPRRPGVPTPVAPSGYARCIAGDGSGLEVSPYCLLENQFIQGKIRHRPSQTGILLLQDLEPFGLFNL